jgi:hypothetical protein
MRFDANQVGLTKIFRLFEADYSTRGIVDDGDYVLTASRKHELPKPWKVVA